MRTAVKTSGLCLALLLTYPAAGLCGGAWVPKPGQGDVQYAQGNRRGVSPEWRGLLKDDYTLSYLLSHSYRDGAGWFNFEAGYTWREGAPADAIPVNVELGYPLPWYGLALKGAVNYVGSMANDSQREPDDLRGLGHHQFQRRQHAQGRAWRHHPAERPVRSRGRL